MATVADVKQQETWAEYVKRVTRSMSQNRVAELTGIAQTNVGRWLRGEAPRSESAVQFARALGEDPLEALVAAGLLDTDELKTAVTLHTSLTEVSDSDLAGEVQRRLVGYNDVIEEMKRRAATGDPRRIEPGSADDVFPPFGNGQHRNARSHPR